jgi:hypothetical protein
VKPANILLEGVDGAPPWAGRAVLVDYELVRPAAAAQPGVTLWASVDFAAPELLLGRTVDARADLFALGVTMHDVFAGRAPRQRTRALADGLEDLRRCRAGIDPGVAELVAALVEPTARWREDSAARTARELTRLARGERFAASPALRLHRLLVRRRRRVARATWLSLTGLLAVAVIALAGDSVRTAVATSESATVAWRRGDLVSAAEALRRPTWLARRLLPARLTALAAGSEPGADPVEDVLSVVFAGDIAGARLRAAQYLERDGLAPHPQLSWFLADALSRDRTQVRVLWTRIFHECPDASPAAVAASAAIRAAFTALLDDDGPDAVWAAAALGGCGDQRSFVAVAAAIVQRLRAGGPSQCEFARVAMMCLRRIVGRSVVCGFDRAVAGAADERLARELGDALRPLDPDLVNARLAPALTDLTTQLAVLGRRANDDRHLPLLALLVEPQRTRVRAAAGDAALRSTLLAGGSCDLDWLGEGQASRFTLADHLGYIAGALGGDDVCAACRRLLDRAGPGGEREFESSRAAGQATARGPTTLEPPDEDSHLGASLRAERTQPIAVACRCSALVAPRVFDCDLTHWPPVLQGEAQQVEAVAVTWPADEVMPDICFARLHLPALSALTFCLPAGPARSASLDLHLCMQKGVRSALPGEGEARVDLLLDGEPIGLGLLVAASTQCDLQVPLCRSSTTPRRLTVRLGAGSTTTLRLYSVSVAAH